VTTLAGQAGAYGTMDGTGSAAQFGRPYGVAAQTDGTLYVTDFQSGRVRVITPQAVVSTLPPVVSHLRGWPWHRRGSAGGGGLGQPLD